MEDFLNTAEVLDLKFYIDKNVKIKKVILHWILAVVLLHLKNILVNLLPKVLDQPLHLIHESQKLHHLAHDETKDLHHVRESQPLVHLEIL